MNDLAAVLPEPAAELQVSRGTIYLELGGVKMSWFRYRYPLLRAPTRWRRTLLASLDELAAMKLSAIYDRGSRRDFVDLYALLESGFDLTSLLEHFHAEYPRANLQHLAKALSYFDDADCERAPIMLWRVSRAQIKARIRQAVAGL